MRNRKNRGLPTYCCYVDFKKAFDLLDRNCLLYKLHCAGVKGYLYKAIASIYKDTKSCVHVNGLYTPWFDVNTGVKQGDIMSPTLFSLYINDLAEAVKQAGIGIPIGDETLSILLYANDVCLLAESAEELQENIDIVANWCNKWWMQISEDKTNVMHCRKPNQERTKRVYLWKSCVRYCAHL